MAAIGATNSGLRELYTLICWYPSEEYLSIAADIGGPGLPPGTGGNGLGGGAYVNAGVSLTLSNDTVTLNSALPGNSSGGVAGQSVGGGVFVVSGGTLALQGSTKIEQNFARNDANVFPPGGNTP